MFSSNQVFEISGSLDQLEDALTFAIRQSDLERCFSDVMRAKGYGVVYQITEDGKYCLGWEHREIPDGWCEYFGFKPTIEIITAIVKQWLEKFPIKESGMDGSCEKGFILRNIDYNTPGVTGPKYGCIYFEPFTCEYHK